MYLPSTPLERILSFRSNMEYRVISPKMVLSFKVHAMYRRIAVRDKRPTAHGIVMYFASQ
jgi:hypothetical protein